MKTNNGDHGTSSRIASLDCKKSSPSSSSSFIPPRMRKKASKEIIPGQRSLSIYTFLGALQSAFWFFALPSLCKPLWPIFFGRLSPKVAEIILFTIPGPYFLIYAMFVALPPYFLDWEFFEQYKISNDPWPWRANKFDNDGDGNGNSDHGRNNKSFHFVSKQQRQQQQQRLLKFRSQFLKSLYIDIASVFLYFPTCIYIKTILFPRKFLSFSLDDWPTIYQSAVIVPAMAIFHELLFYASHRLMHSHPSLYKFHKVHHEYKQNTVLAAQYFHLVDFVLTISGPVVLTTLLFRPHSFTMFQVGLWIFTANLDDHLGYAFPWSAVRCE